MGHDLRYAARAMARTPGFAAIVIATLALAIGATSSLFSVVDAVLLRPLPYLEPDRLFQVLGTDPQQSENRHSPGDYLDLKKRARCFRGLAGYEEMSFELSGRGEPQRIRGAEVTEDFFDVFGVRAALGRTFDSVQDRPGSGRLALVSDALWRKSWGGSPDLVGQLLRLNGESVQVVGILPASFDWPPEIELWTLAKEPVPASPIALTGNPLGNRELQYFDAVGRLAPRVDVESAQAEIASIARDLQRQYPRTNHARSWRLVPLRDQLVSHVRRALTILLAAIALVWLVACANIATLMLARAARRQKEMAIRASLGASGKRLLAQLLSEGLLLALAGGAAGLLAAIWGTRLLVRLAPPSLPRLSEVSLDGRAAAVALALSVAAGVLFGLAPALSGRRRDLSAALINGARTTGGSGPSSLRASLVVGELGLALVLLSGAGLLLNSFFRLTRVDPGFSPHGLLSVQLPLPRNRYPDAKRQSQFYGDLIQGLRATSEVADAATVFPMPLDGGGATANVTTQERGPSTDGPLCEIVSVSPGYFRTLGAAVRSGRDFDTRDTATAPATAVASASLAARLWPLGNPIGHLVRIGSGASAATATIVGVVPDLRLRRLGDAPPLALYLPVGQFVLPFLSIVVRGRGDSGALLPAVTREIHGLDPELPLGEVRPIERIVEDSVSQPRFRAWTLAAFAAAALALASLGVYGIVSGSVLARTREFAVRIALGAHPGHVRRLILKEGAALAILGTALGLAGAALLTRVLKSLLFGIGPTDIPTLLAVSLLLDVVVLLACLIPARRATRVDPNVALRQE